jgi:aspartate aminotransferase
MPHYACAVATVLADDIEALLRPLEAFETIRRRAVMLGDRLCDLSYANPYGMIEARVREVLRAAIARERALAFQYSPYGGQTLVRRAVADSLRERFGAEVSFQDVVMTPGAMAALQIALRLVGRPGDEVVVPAPCWLDYPLYARWLGLVPVHVPLTPDSFDVDPDAIEGAMTPRTCAVLLSHPSNPAGRSYAPERLAALAAALGRAERRIGRPLTVIADEAHRDFAPDTYQSLAQHWPATFLVYSFGKYHFLQGQRTGYLAVWPGHPERRTMAEAAVRLCRVMGFCTPSALMQNAVPGLLALRHDLAFVNQWRTRMVRELTASGYVVAPADATLFLYLRVPNGGDDMAFVRALADRGLLALPAAVFHHRGWFRLSLTGSEPMMEGALHILREVRAA